MPIVSIIVPVFNTEKYIDRCIKSILNQTFSDFELLLINDGSTDTSGEICDEYAKKDNRVRVFHEKNKGVSSARNLGLDNSKGEWITFCDSDDWVESNWLENFVINSNDVQLVVQSFNLIGCKMQPIEGRIFEGKSIDGIKLLYESFMPGSLCNKMIKHDIIYNNNLYLNRSLFFREDEEFLLRLYPNIKDMRILPYKSYNYIVPEFNVKYKKNGSLFYQFIIIYKSLKNEFYSSMTIIKSNYIKDLTSSLFESYENNDVDRKTKLKLYKSVIGSDVNICKHVNGVFRLLLSVGNLGFLDIILSLRTIIKNAYYFKA